ncbi:MAG: ABC transporter ATP-binding protein [Nanoarchaeota archaeon]
MLKIKNLKKNFGGVKAVDGCSFEIKPNTINALIGPNGSGKTTVFNLIAGILKEKSGKIIFSKTDITSLSPEEISRIGISRVFQKTRLFNNLTIKDNLILAIDEEDTLFWKCLLAKNKTSQKKLDKIKRVLELVNMENFENKPCRNLSYGQRKLIELARAIINPHQLLMLDEPVAGVNPRLRNKIAKLLQNLKKQSETVLFIEHDMNFALGIADNVIVMDEGKVIASGTPQKIRKNPAVLDAYLGD